MDRKEIELGLGRYLVRVLATCSVVGTWWTNNNPWVIWSVTKWWSILTCFVCAQNKWFSIRDLALVYRNYIVIVQIVRNTIYINVCITIHKGIILPCWYFLITKFELQQQTKKKLRFKNSMDQILVFEKYWRLFVLKK